MSVTTPTRSTTWRPVRQRGAALAISLILLLVITLIGLAAIRGTTLQQRITANFYDRSISFQNAEAALQAGSLALATNNPAIISRNCGAGGVTCLANPFTDAGFTGAIQTVTTGTNSGQFTAGTNATGQPQYVIENMGLWNDPDTNTGFNQSANAAQYGAQGTSIQRIYYRITARSCDPASSGCAARAVVTLQAIYRQ